MPEDRLCSDWLQAYLEWTSAQESPESLHLWSALNILSAATRRRIFIEMEYSVIYPNLYIIIVAESAKVRKSTAMDLARNVFLAAFPTAYVFRDSGTSQGMIKMLNKKTEIIKDGEKKEIQQSVVAIFADEVANLFSYVKGQASAMTIFLTSAYGAQDVYDHTTSRDSQVRLYNLYPTLLGGTDPRNLKVLPEDAVGGLTGRLIWVIESRRRHINSGWKKPQDKDSIKRKLLRELVIRDLQTIGNLQGEMTVTLDAQEHYDAWYHDLSTRDTHDPDMDAFYQRCHTTAIKVAMLYSLSRSNDMCVTIDDMKTGIDLIEKQFPDTKHVGMWSGGSDFEQKRAKLIHFLQQNPAGAQLWNAALRHLGMPADEFEMKLVTTLLTDGTITIPGKIKGQRVLQLTKAGADLNPSQEEKK